MAFDPAPNAWISNFSEDGTDITIPLGSLPGLTAAEADGATGDIRKVLRAIMDVLQREWSDLDAADRPTKMTLSRSTSVNDETGDLRRTYSATFDLEATEEEVVDEPV